jgi:hypothetical protein
MRLRGFKGMGLPGFTATESLFNTKSGADSRAKSNINFNSIEKILPQRKILTGWDWDDNGCAYWEWEDDVEMVSGRTSLGFCL